MYPEYYFELSTTSESESEAVWSEYETVVEEGVADGFHLIDEVNFQLSAVAEVGERMRKPMRRAGEIAEEFGRRSYKAN